MDPVSIGAIGWSISIAGWLISSIISERFKKCLAYLGFLLSDSRLKELERKVLELKWILEQAEANPEMATVEKRLRQWMQKLKSAFYEADDIFDEIDYYRLKSHIHSQTTTQNAGIDLTAPILLRYKLEETLIGIEKLIDEGRKLLFVFKLSEVRCCCIKNTPNNIGRSIDERPQTTSEPPTVVFGRDEELKKIRIMLRTPADDETKCSVIGIHGIPGSGKTTLAEYVCKHEREDGYFNLIMWIHVSQNFNVHTILTEMLEIASDKGKVEIRNLDKLHCELKEALRGKRFFLVLDDVWYSEDVSKDEMNKIIYPLKAGTSESKILVTTRDGRAAMTLGAQEKNLVAISDLDKKQFVAMFMHYALDGAEIRDQALLRKYWSIGEKIAEKLGRSPLAASTVAGQLNIRRDIDFWISTMKSDLLNNKTIGALWWSYRQLHEPVKQCFRYCSMFPRRYELHRDNIVQLWVAEGFVQTANSEEDMEDVGNGYFHVLLSTSFIQLKRSTGVGMEYFTIHDLLHDLAEKVSGSDCFRIEKDMVGQIPQGVRHLFIGTYDCRVFREQILKLDNLRTLVMSCSAFSKTMTEDDFECMLMSLKKLRVVHVCIATMYSRSLAIPSCIGRLKHLRDLRLFGSSINEITLPSSFTKLYHLQNLFVPAQTRLTWPSHIEMGNLVNLRYLQCDTTFFPNIGSMRCLRNLYFFRVTKERGYEIQQLEHLDNIRGTLHIKGLRNVNSKEEARQAMLDNKLHVSDLVLDWEPFYRWVQNPDVQESRRPRLTGFFRSGPSQHGLTNAEGRTSGQTPNHQGDVLEALRPPFLVTSLRIRNYNGSTYPSWMSAEQDTLQNLQHLEFSCCTGSDVPPKISESLLGLRTLDILNCSWNSLPENMEHLPMLEKLTIRMCNNILSIPRLPPPSLKELELLHLDASDAPHWICEHIINLTRLDISGCTWNSFPENMDRLEKLEELVMGGYTNILSLPRLPLSLRKLKLDGWKGLHAPRIGCDFLDHLCELNIFVCQWNSLPEDMECLTSLEKLTINSCPKIQSIPRLPGSLKKLYVSNCNRSFMDSCLTVGHPNWENIEHILEKCIR